MRLRLPKRALLVAALSLLVCAGTMRWINNARTQRDVVAAIRALGGVVIYDYEMSDVVPPAGYKHTGRPCYVDLLHRVSVIDLEGSAVTDDSMPAIERLGTLHKLGLIGTRVTGKTLRRISIMRIQAIEIKGGRIVDDDLAALGQIRSLKHIYLSGIAISDAGLEHLCSLPQLEIADLQGTDVTSGGAGRVESCTAAKVVLHPSP